MSVAGSNVKYSFDNETKVFNMEYNADRESTAPSLVFLPSHIFHENMHLKHSPGLVVRAKIINTG